MKYILTLGLIACFMANSWAQADLSLEQAIATGLKNNYQIEIAKKRMDAAKVNNTVAAAGAYPRVTAGFNSNNSFLVVNNPTSFLDGNTLAGLGLTPTVDVAWTLFDNYKVSINKERLEQLEEQSVGNSDLVVENNINAIVLAYYRAVIEQGKIEVFQQVMDLSRDRYDFEVAKQELGTGSTFQVVQVKDAFLSDSTNLLRQQNAYRASVRNLNIAMGEETTSTNYTLTDALNLDAQVYNNETLRQKMTANNRTLRNQMLNQKLLNTNVKLQKSNKWYMPKISVNTGLNEALSQNFLWNDALPDVVSAGGRQFTYYLNFSVSFSLYNGGTYKRAIQNAIINREIGALNISDQKRTLFGQLDNQLATYQDQLNIIALNDQVIANAQQNLNISEERYKRALINSFDYRNVQLAYLRAALTRLESIYSLKVLETELTRLTGGFVTGE
jgi:outer membrane protein